MSGSMSPAQQAQALRAQNDAITQLLMNEGEAMLQPIFTANYTPTSTTNVLSIPLRAVGLSRGCLVRVTASFTNSGAGVATLTPWGASNLLSNVTFTDLDSYQRINTTGWHLNMLNTAKEGQPFGTALLATAFDGGVKYGNNMAIMPASATLAASGGTGTVTTYYWVPFAYGVDDLRGAVYTGVVNATAFLQLTLNPAPGTNSDPTLAVYSGTTTNVAYTNATVTVLQDYIDQIPRYTSGPMLGRPILPQLSLSTQYRLVTTALTGLSPNQGFAVPFTNFQSFLSLGLIYDQAGVLAAGTDITNFSLTAANTLQFFTIDPFVQALRQRVRIKTDFPIGSYMFDFRRQPINSNQAGNIQLTLTPTTAANGSQVLVGFEAFAMVNSLLGAQSLPQN